MKSNADFLFTFAYFHYSIGKRKQTKIKRKLTFGFIRIVDYICASSNFFYPFQVNYFCNIYLDFFSLISTIWLFFFTDWLLSKSSSNSLFTHTSCVLLIRCFLCDTIPDFLSLFHLLEILSHLNLKNYLN